MTLARFGDTPPCLGQMLPDTAERQPSLLVRKQNSVMPEVGHQAVGEAYDGHVEALAQSREDVVRCWQCAGGGLQPQAPFRRQA